MNECDPEAGCDWEEGNRGGREFNGLRVTVCVCVCVELDNVNGASVCSEFCYER